MARQISLQSAGARATSKTVRGPVDEGPAVPSRPSTILVIDDECDTRAALSDALEDSGYVVLVAANGQEGLDLLPSLSEPCAVILDLTMPVMNGVELYRIMKATPALAGIPVLISTADPGRAPKGARLMTKPVTLERLLVAVAAMC